MFRLVFLIHVSTARLAMSVFRWRVLELCLLVDVSPSPIGPLGGGERAKHNVFQDDSSLKAQYILRWLSRRPNPMVGSFDRVKSNTLSYVNSHLARSYVARTNTSKWEKWQTRCWWSGLSDRKNSKRHLKPFARGFVYLIYTRLRHVLP